ncbi:alkaline phosphatase D family protein [Microseira wollei]|uniref:Phosphodiesterase/alkaline phosphatase D-like protein n=1 Tax=Microseira wollei NIES-4236 TaxID=2530354 RepID=A0AAV3X8V9_9CYAN|nr:alkaline phosphatase D family protein [Microseira wollei]GET36712.1 phosphodiesterase/alkaline phosphatase D-like protein [Microseira wollei NIES-4236]
MLDTNSLFNSEFYLSLYPDVAAAVGRGEFRSGLEHYRRFGQFEGRQPSALYNEQFYLNLYQDIAAAVARKETTGIQHFIRFGQFEGRDPSALFNTKFYFEQNPDVARAVDRDELTGIEHFVKFGKQEGRDPSLLFSNSFYRENNRDVADAVNRRVLPSLLDHYLLFGQRESRRPSPFADPQGRTLPNGVASGDTTQTSSVLWTRSNTPGRVLFEYSTDPNFRNVQRQLESFVTDPSLPVKVQLNGLNPGTQYFYRVTDASGNSAVGQFRTSASVGTRAGLRFGVSGDWRGELAPYPAIANADERNLDFFVLHGDTIYADFPSPDLPREQARTLQEFRIKHNEVYGRRNGVNTWGDLRASTSVLATIDDHEVSDDFSGGTFAARDRRFEASGNLINDTNLYENSLRAFQEYNPIRDEFYGETGDDRTAFERKLYRFNTYGSDAAVMILDNRSFRDAPLPGVANINDPTQVRNFLTRAFDIDPLTGQPTPRRTLLGQQQIADLKRDLLAAQNSGITWKFIMTPEPMQNLGLIGAPDRFEGYAAERTEILRFIEENGITNVVFVAADIHGTVVNNLTYQNAPGTVQIPTGAFEITTGSVAFDAPLGPTVVDIGAESNLITPQQRNTYNTLPRQGKDQFIEQFVNNAIAPLGYDPIGLQNSPINSTLLRGSYVSAHTYGWTEFEINPQTQQLRVTTYGIDSYTEEQLKANPSEIISRTPTVVSEFVVNPQLVRFATFNASLNRNSEGELIRDLSTPNNAQAKAVAETIQRTQPDVVLINEFDYDNRGPNGSSEALRLLADNYLSVSQNGATPINYPFRYIAPSNTGVASGFDLDNNGSVVTNTGAPGYGNDAFGFGNFPGQFGMALYSKYPIKFNEIRRFQNLLWKDMPGALLPDNPATPAPNDWYSPAELNVFRLSSKSHWDVPIDVNGKTVHLLLSHPTPPVFDGPEDRNGTRNHDEIRLWADYITPGQGNYIYDDNRRFGGLAPGASFVIMGDQNADPFDGDSTNNAILQLLNNPLVNTSVTPAAPGGLEQAFTDGGNNSGHRGKPVFDTADFGDTGNNPGNLRVDYVLPSANLPIAYAAIFWPLTTDPLYRLVGDRQNAQTTPASDHSLVWADAIVR